MSRGAGGIASAVLPMCARGPCRVRGCCLVCSFFMLVLVVESTQAFRRSLSTCTHTFSQTISIKVWEGITCGSRNHSCSHSHRCNCSHNYSCNCKCNCTVGITIVVAAVVVILRHSRCRSHSPVCGCGRGGGGRGRSGRGRDRGWGQG